MNELHAQALKLEFDWLSRVIDTRLRTFFGDQPCILPDPPKLPEGAAYTDVVSSDRVERIIFALALVRVVTPATLDPFLIENTSLKRHFTEFGGVTQNNKAGFVPTGETAAFLVAGVDLIARATAATALFSPQGLIARHLIQLEGASDLPPLAQCISVSNELATQLLTGIEPEPDFSTNFPAVRLTTNMRWDDLVLGNHTFKQVNHILEWLKHESRLLDDWGLRRALSPGYRVLFHGPPGTGKTLTAALLGKSAQRPVFRVDLSMVVSKYIGETEKNLARVFDRAESGNWILFFDEADALFGKRTQTSSSNDRHANQEISYLLQKVETSPGLTILATNLRGNIDTAFSRRFQSLVTFTRPDEKERIKLWNGILECGVPLERDVSLQAIARDHRLTGGEIVNVIRHAGVLALSTGREAVSHQDFEMAIGAEQRKEGRSS